MEIPEKIANIYANKLVSINLNQLSNIIKESTTKVLSELGYSYNPESWTYKKIITDALIRAASEAHLIDEMACDRKTYRQNAIHLAWQIIENWSLCYYCVMMDIKNQNFGHWKVELASHLGEIKRTGLKKGSGDKKTVLTDLYINMYDFNDPKNIESVIRGKFYIEQLKDSSIISFVANAFAENINDVIDLLVNPDRDLKVYMEEMFPQL